MSEFNYKSADCLVLCIEETISTEDTTNGPEKDTTLFVLYDSYDGWYLIRGKRSNYRGKTPHTYSFETKSASAVCDFVSLVIPKYHSCTFELYKYDDLPDHPDDITFESLTKGRSALNELVAYVGMRSTDKMLSTICSVIRKVYNEYIPAGEEEKTPK
jgi:hypothetical protein